MKEFVRPNLFVSECIEHKECRFDGTIISDSHVKRLKNVCNIITACPEMAIGLGSPRESLRLVLENENIKLMSTQQGIDYTNDMVTFSNRYLKNLKKKNIDGFILKAKSPSCGTSGVKLYRGLGKAHTVNAKNPGIFGKLVLSHFSNLPIENERRLSNFNIRDKFYIKLFTLASFRKLKEDFSYKKLVQFHTDNKYLFMTFHQLILKELGNIVSNHNKLPHDEVINLYEKKLIELFEKEPTKPKRINVLSHVYGYFKNDISIEEKAYYLDIMDDYLNNKVPYSNLIGILHSWTIRFNQSYLKTQTILNPYPKELISILDSGKQT